MLNWANQFNIFCFLDNHQYSSEYNSYECILAVGATAIFKKDENALSNLDAFITDANDWIFGHFSYDLINEIENLSSQKPDNIGFPDIFLFVPKIVIRLSTTELVIEILEGDADIIFSEIEKQPIEYSHSPVAMQPRISKEGYISSIQKILKHIQRGDCYELNFCQEFFAENVSINPLSVYLRLQQFSPTPFSAFYRVNDSYLMCASPERYLKRTGDTIISQPIKGTSARDENETQDELNRSNLSSSEKDKSENVMVVDLVRNDLSRICKKGTVQVDELFGIYSFPNVHQMISTVSGTLEDDIPFAEIIRSTFPMGSMTGAPKRRVMELIDKYETSRRGIFSGAVGYMAPDGDFDFNVVIRSLMYNAGTGYLSYQVGGGITANSHPEKEYEECLVKASAINRVLGG